MQTHPKILEEWTIEEDFWAVNKVESLVFTSLYPIQFLTVKIPTCQNNGTVNSLLMDTSIRQTPLLEGHLVLVPAIYKSFYCNYTLYKTDKEHLWVLYITVNCK